MAAPSEGFWQRRGALGLYELLLTWWRHCVSFVTSVFITFFALALYYFTFVGERSTPIFNFVQRLEYDSLDTRFRYRPRSATAVERMGPRWSDSTSTSANEGRVASRFARRQLG